ncbi:uncharacterized protein isoform X2 [Rhodnius prolixus]|uniref:uncharacterized protein isoform X2 n=1 Tax=Rhodnius prolixus TaxID=13249 RepID=UPI003D189020
MAHETSSSISTGQKQHCIQVYLQEKVDCNCFFDWTAMVLNKIAHNKAENLLKNNRINNQHKLEFLDAEKGRIIINHGVISIMRDAEWFAAFILYLRTKPSSLEWLVN